MSVFDRKLPRVVTNVTIISIAALLLNSCTNPFSSKPAEKPKEAVPPVETYENIQPFLRLSGSNTIGSELAPALVEAWLSQKKGAIDIHRIPGKADEVKIVSKLEGQTKAVEIKAHGSATGFVDLGASSTDIAMSSRKINDAEKAKLASLNLGDEKVIGLDAVVVIVNEANGVTAMTKDQIKAVFTGQDKSRPWHINSRDRNSGTFDTFKAKVLDPAPLVSTAKLFEDSRALASAVASDPDGIGFIGLPYAVGVKKLQIQEKGATPVEPSVLTVKNESYPLTRRLYFYVPQQASGDARQFTDFVISEAGQDVVDKVGFVSQKIEITKPDPQRPEETRIPGADVLSTTFYFRPGSYELDPRGEEDLKRLAALLSAQDSTRAVILVGFADNIGNEDYNLQLSRVRASMLAQKLQLQGVVAKATTGFGSALPIADNTTEEGRAKNRRVEVWIR